NYESNKHQFKKFVCDQCQQLLYGSAQNFADADFAEAFFDGKRGQTGQADTANKNGQACKNIGQVADKLFSDKFSGERLVHKVILKYIGRAVARINTV